MKRLLLPLILALAFAHIAAAQSVRITQKPTGIVHGDLLVPVTTAENVDRVEMFVNNWLYAKAAGRSVVMKVKVGEYLRRLRIRVVGYDAQNNVAGVDEMVVNDPKPPFRVRLSAPPKWPESGEAALAASIVAPPELRVTSVELFVGETKAMTFYAPPYSASLAADKFTHPVYARVVAHASDGSEANDVMFFGEQPRDAIDVTLQQIPVSVAAGDKRPLKLEDLTLLDNGAPRKIESLLGAGDQPLYVILLIDYSESMLEELPVVKAAAKQFAQRLLRPTDRIAVVGFNQSVFWLTPFTNDFTSVAASVDRVKPQGETHLYDTAIEMLYELQKQPGRHALVILTDGVDQGSKFQLDHLVHYARYAGVPVYPIVKNKRLSTLMRFGVGRLEARKLDAIARDTGATYFIIQKESELPAVYEKLADELRQQYQVVFYSDSAPGDTWHPLLIQNRGGQQLRIPRGYFP